MNTYKRYRFPSEIISYAFCLYCRFSHRDIADLVAECRITVTYEAICFRCIVFGALYAQSLKRIHGATPLTFDGTVTEILLPKGDIPLALFAFNIGFEAGQLVFIGAVLVAVWIGRRFTRLRRLSAAMPVHFM